MLASLTILGLAATLGAEPAPETSPLRIQLEIGSGLDPISQAAYPAGDDVVLNLGAEWAAFGRDNFFVHPTARVDWRHLGFLAAPRDFPDYPEFAYETWHATHGLRVGWVFNAFELFFASELGTTFGLVRWIEHGYPEHTSPGIGLTLRGGFGVRVVLLSRVLAFLLTEGGGDFSFYFGPPNYLSYRSISPYLHCTAGLGVRL
jgi:hypothetical protein